MATHQDNCPRCDHHIVRSFCEQKIVKELLYDQIIIHNCKTEEEVAKAKARKMWDENYQRIMNQMMEEEDAKHR